MFVPPPTYFLVIICAAVFLLLFTLVWYGSWKLSRRSILSVLQGGNVRKTKTTAVSNAGRGDPVAPPNPLTASTGAVRGDPRVLQNPSIDLSNMPPDPHQGSYYSRDSMAASARFVYRYITRAPLGSALTAAIAAVFVLALGWMAWTVEHSHNEINRLYDTTPVYAELTSFDPARPHAQIGNSVIARIRDGGDVAATNAALLTLLFHVNGDRDVDFQIQTFDNPAAIFGTWKDTEIEYAEGWDAGLFNMTIENIQEKWPPLPVVMSSHAAQILGFGLGDRLEAHIVQWVAEATTHIGWNWVRRPMPVDAVIAGIFESMGSGYDAHVLMPLEVLGAFTPDFHTGNFIINPAMNRELDDVAERMDEIARWNARGFSPLSFTIWDEELRLVIEPLEGALSLLVILFPVTLAVSLLIAAGLAVLKAMQNAKTIAGLRTLGITKFRVTLMLVSEQVAVCAVGLLAGLGILAAVYAAVGADGTGAVTRAALYLAGALAGSAGAVIATVMRKPLELLQVRD
jgi:hypothetical protein